MTKYHGASLLRKSNNKANENHPGLNPSNIFLAPKRQGKLFHTCHKTGFATKPLRALHCVDTPLSAWYVSNPIERLCCARIASTILVINRGNPRLKFKKEGWNENRYLLPYCPAKLL
jgi:hypothetical protein